MTPEAEAAHREPDPIRGYGSDFDPTTEGTRLVGEFVFHDGHWWYAGRVERETAHRDSPLREALVRLTKIDQRTQVGDCITLINAALAAEPIAASSPAVSHETPTTEQANSGGGASSRLDVERLARALDVEAHNLYATDNRQRHDMAVAIAAQYERLRATPEPEGSLVDRLARSLHEQQTFDAECFAVTFDDPQCPCRTNIERLVSWDPDKA